MRYDKTRRKYREDMSQEERNTIKSIIRNYNEWMLIYHAQEEMAKDKISSDEVFDTLHSGRIIEIHNCKEFDLCVLVQKAFENRAINAVVSLVNGKVITAWANSLEDAQRTPNLANYQWAKFDATQLKGIGKENVRIANKIW